jgi:hypothetical protein
MDLLKAIQKMLAEHAMDSKRGKAMHSPWLCYTAHGLKFGFLAARKLSRINDRKPVNIRNMNQFTIVDSSGFGALKIQI